MPPNIIAALVIVIMTLILCLMALCYWLGILVAHRAVLRIVRTHLYKTGRTQETRDLIKEITAAF